MTITDYKERELTEIAGALKSIDRSLKEMLEISRTNHAVQPVGDDCSNCLCAACANRETCKLKLDGIMPGVYGSPCNGCGQGQRFMQIGKDKCKDFKERQERRS